VPYSDIVKDVLENAEFFESDSDLCFKLVNELRAKRPAFNSQRNRRCI